MRFRLKLTCAVTILAASLSHANAVTFANYIAAMPGSANIALSGTTLSANAPVLFDYTFPSALANFGFIDANLTLNAQESGALGLGPASFGLFSGTFSIAYAGGNVTVSGVTLTPGEVLLAGVFQNAPFDALGSAGSVIDSFSGGGTVTYSSALLNFSNTSDRSFSIGLTDINPVPAVNGIGQLSNFTAVSQGEFASDDPSAVPEPATWALMTLGFVGLGIAGYGRGRKRRALPNAA